MTTQQVKEFCDDTRQLAAQINAYVNKWEAYQGKAPPPFTPRERRRADVATMLLETAKERL